MSKSSETIKTDDLTSGEMDIDAHELNWQMDSSFFLSFMHFITLRSRGYFFLMDTDSSRRSRVNEAQSAEEKKITSGHRSTQPHFHVISGSNISPNRFWAPWDGLHVCFH